MTFLNRQTAAAWATTASLVSLTTLTTGCSSVGDALSGDKVDYRQTGAQVSKLEVPPDLSQLPGQTRYGQASNGTVTASSLGSAAGSTPAPNAVGSVALNQAGAYKLARDGQTRWLVANATPEQLWQPLHDFWTEQGFTLLEDNPKAGLITTDYLENRAKVPQDGAIRKALGSVFSALYDSGERDQYRMRLERTAQGTEIYVAQRGLIEEYETKQKDRTVWRARPNDPQLEAAMLARLLVKLGVPKAEAEATLAADTPAAPAAPATTVAAAGKYARLNADKVSLSLDSDFDTAWRRLSLAIDRSGYTVESRDRKQGVFEIRLSDSDVEANRPGFFARLFGAKAMGDGLSRFRVTLQTGADKKGQVQVLSDTGKAIADNAMAQKVAKQLQDELN